MAIPRGITAGVVALVITLLLGGGEIGLVLVGHDAALGVLVLPAAFLAGHLGLERRLAAGPPGAGRWVRLGLMPGGHAGAAFGGYTGWRAWSVPDVGPIARPSDWVAARPRCPTTSTRPPSIARPRASWTKARPARVELRR